MRKGWFLAGAIFLLSLFLLPGCGGTQEEDSATLAELGTLQEKLQSAQVELEATQARISELTSILEETRANLDAAQAELAAAKAAPKPAGPAPDMAELAELEKQISSLQTDLDIAAGKINTLQTLNSGLSENLKKVDSPRHFESLQELTDWVKNDDTNTAYPDATQGELAYILQVRATRDGYILPASIEVLGENIRILNNLAVVGEQIYAVRAIDDLIAPYFFSLLRLPLYPLPVN